MPCYIQVQEAHGIEAAYPNNVTGLKTVPNDCVSQMPQSNFDDLSGSQVFLALHRLRPGHSSRCLELDPNLVPTGRVHGALFTPSACPPMVTADMTKFVAS